MKPPEPLLSAKEDELLCRYLDGRLAEADKDALQDVLRNNPVARKRLRMLAAVTEGISGREVTPKAVAAHPRNALIPWIIAVAAIIMAIVGWMDRFVPGAKSDPKPSSDPFVALLVDEAGAIFSKGKAPDDIRFQQGHYQLERGAIHVRFANGADVMMQAPTAFEINDTFHMRLHHGEIRAVVPLSAQGFTVAARGIDYEDRGTEFALSMDRDTGVSALHVIDGQVDAKYPQSKKLISAITEGQSVEYAEGALHSVDTPDLNAYPMPGSLGVLRWEQQRADFGKDDPDLIGYYPFTKAELLQNEAPRPVTGNGRIHGARWVAGRWPGKAALLFDRDTDFVELDIPGEYEELSFAAWLKIDRLDFSHSAIFNSNGWGTGDVHWQVYRNGAMDIGYDGAHGIEKTTLETVPADQWIHLAGTISRSKKTNYVYLNGKLAGSVSTKPTTSIQAGLGRIGGWLMEAESDSAPIRSLRGKMDEFAIWKRALTEAEVMALVERGRPSALWPTESR